MNVGELEELLAMLPADMPVMILSGSGCRHITEVAKRPRRRVDDEFSAAFGDVVHDDNGRYPPHVVLRSGAFAPLWMQAWADDVAFEVTGRWPSKVQRR